MKNFLFLIILFVGLQSFGIGSKTILDTVTKSEKGNGGISFYLSFKTQTTKTQEMENDVLVLGGSLNLGYRWDINDWFSYGTGITGNIYFSTTANDNHLKKDKKRCFSGTNGGLYFNTKFKILKELPVFIGTTNSILLGYSYYGEKVFKREEGEGINMILESGLELSISAPKKMTVQLGIGIYHNYLLHQEPFYYSDGEEVLNSYKLGKISFGVSLKFNFGITKGSRK